MKPDIAFDRTIVVNADGEVVHTLLELTAPNAPEVGRNPIDVAIVIDRSGSMGGGKLTAVTEAVARLIRQAGPDDRIGVVAFDSTVTPVLPLGRHTTVEAVQQVLDLRPGGSTNLSGGWLAGRQMLAEELREGALRRIVVLTDGHANAGVVDTDPLADMVSGGRVDSISTSFIGFGDGYDEDLLAALADSGSGNDYFCADADQAAAVFGDELGGLARVVAQNITVDVIPTAAVAVAGQLNDYPVTSLGENGSVRISIGDAFGGEVRPLMLAFHLRPQPGSGQIDVAQLVLRWVSTVDGFIAHEVSVPVSVTAGVSGSHDAGADPRVVEQVTVLTAARQRREARRLADQHEFEEAAAAMTESRRLLAQTSASSDSLAELDSEIRRLRQRRWDGFSSKASLSASREAMRSRRKLYISPDPDRDGKDL
jgi:Ca-activated chloride channel family protein